MHEKITRGLRVGVFCLKFLRYICVIPNVWYASELRLAKLRGIQLAKIFRQVK